MSEPVALSTPLGELYGRSVDLEQVVLSCYPRELRVRCHVWRTGASVPCEFRFLGVVGVRVDELDFSELSGRASFVEVLESPWLASCRARDHSRKVLAEHRHIALRTYDDVIEVLCTGYEIVPGVAQVDSMEEEGPCPE